MPSESAPARSRGELATLARGGALNAVGLVASMALGFLSGVVITRALHASGAGVFFSALAVTTVLGTIVQFGADTGAVRMLARALALGRTAELRGLLAAALTPIALVGVVVAAVVALFAHRLAGWVFADPAEVRTATVYLRVLGAFIPATAVMRTLLASTRGLGTMVPSVTIDKIGASALRPALLLLAIALGLGSLGVVVMWSVPTLVGLVAAAGWLVVLVRRADRSHSGAHALPRPRSAIVREFWRFSFFRGVAAVLGSAILWLDVPLVGALASAHDAGVYGAASRFLMAGSFALQAVLFVIGPQISGLLAVGSLERARDVYQASTAWLTALSFPFYLTLAAFGPVLLRVFGPGFDSGSKALLVLSLAMLLNMATGPVTTVLLMAGKSSWNLWTSSLAVSVNVGLNFVLIPRYGIVGAAFAWAATVVVQNVIPLLQIWIALELQPLSRAFALAAGAALVSYGAIGVGLRLALGATGTGLALYLVLATIAYLALLWRFRRPLMLDFVVDAFVRRVPGHESAGAA